MDDAVFRGFAAVGIVACVMALAAVCVLCIVVVRDAWQHRGGSAATEHVACTCGTASHSWKRCLRHDP